ncbi:YybH family protein [Actinoalloteichus hymeniacidonis]|uniref:DUF4440 domain-containing protein n=1 Tax=Actinoalloteichus hymeniacidonis TaxID=340345 RepID=A0AAC9MWK7_9PSEU|nr:SgcJ/EcaC family oxidoreductase [Actinoalloteichus hymeniacidonis]AOS60932.1 hypothetical protein TL08_00420 [Actinoalloteichus hymeniacidonis]MBB5911068.1 uncharacterized protein (TIGR02246 family) [Actinoalloteichus hymeniacidonis]
MTTAAHLPPMIDDDTTDHHEDIAAITQVIADTQTAFNTNDADLLTEHFAENATVVNAVGMMMSGRPTLHAANQRGLAGFLRDEYARYEVLDVRFPRPDVALAYKNARSTTPEGELIDVDPTMIALYVLVKEAGRWWVIARQNTLVP